MNQLMFRASTFLLYNLVCLVCVANSAADPQSHILPENSGPKQKPTEKSSASKAVVVVNADLDLHGDEKDTTVEESAVRNINKTIARGQPDKESSDKNVEHSNFTNHGLPPGLDSDPIGSGALLRGFYVFLGMSVIVLLYYAINTYRLRKGEYVKHVRKYGVRARRGDVEMLPLPLEDEEDDDTVFDVGNSSLR